MSLLAIARFRFAVPGHPGQLRIVCVVGQPDLLLLTLGELEELLWSGQHARIDLPNVGIARLVLDAAAPLGIKAAAYHGDEVVDWLHMLPWATAETEASQLQKATLPSAGQSIDRCISHPEEERIA